MGSLPLNHLIMNTIKQFIIQNVDINLSNLLGAISIYLFR